jgi:hypothetical protein
MVTKMKEAAKRALEKLPENEVVEVLNFINYLQWRRKEIDQSWFWTEEWQKRYQESKEDLSEGNFQDFEDVEMLISDRNDII